MSSDFQQLVGSAELSYIGLIDSEFNRSSDVALDMEDLPKFFCQEILGDPIRVSEDDAGRQLISCQIRCRVWVDPSEHGDHVSRDQSYSTGKMKISAVYLIAFDAHGVDEISDKSVSMFCHRIGIMSVWPYFRSHCSHYANESGLRLPALPLKKAVYPIKEIKSEEDFKEFKRDEKSA